MNAVRLQALQNNEKWKNGIERGEDRPEKLTCEGKNGNMTGESGKVQG
jgi:hypothetical protein